MTLTAILVAAGRGTRLGLGVPKAFVPLAGRPLLSHALAALQAAVTVDEVVVVVGPEDVGDARGVVGPAVRVVGGGHERRDSVRAGLAAAEGADVVAVHDAARPLVTPELVDATVRALVAPWAGVAPALPVVDTLKLVEPATGRVLRTLERSGLHAVQTPQVFAAATLARVHAGPEVPATDDLALVEAAGEPVRLVAGSSRNLKITFPADLVTAEALLAQPLVAGRET